MYASRAIARGDVVEICPVVQFKGRVADLPADLRTIIFSWAVLADQPGVHAIALGYGSMYNHANPANMSYAASQDGHFLVIHADVDIEADTELTINYNAQGGGPTSDGDTWFRNANVICLDSAS